MWHSVTFVKNDIKCEVLCLEWHLCEILCVLKSICVFWIDLIWNEISWNVLKTVYMEDISHVFDFENVVYIIWLLWHWNMYMLWICVKFKTNIYIKQMKHSGIWFDTWFVHVWNLSLNLEEMIVCMSRIDVSILKERGEGNRMIVCIHFEFEILLHSKHSTDVTVSKKFKSVLLHLYCWNGCAN